MNANPITNRRVSYRYRSLPTSLCEPMFRALKRSQAATGFDPMTSDRRAAKGTAPQGSVS